MKYKEFREYLKLNKIDLKEDEERLIADNKFEISKDEEHSIVLVQLPYELDLTEKVIELAETPLDAREEVKKYYLRHRFINYSDAEKYFNYFGENFIKLNDRREGPHYKTKFTEAEIEGLKEKFDTDLRDFKMIEAED